MKLSNTLRSSDATSPVRIASRLRSTTSIIACFDALGELSPIDVDLRHEVAMSHPKSILTWYDNPTEVVGMDVQPDVGKIGNVLACN